MNALATSEGPSLHGGAGNEVYYVREDGTYTIATHYHPWKVKSFGPDVAESSKTSSDVSDQSGAEPSPGDTERLGKADEAVLGANSEALSRTQHSWALRTRYAEHRAVLLMRVDNEFSGRHKLAISQMLDLLSSYEDAPDVVTLRLSIGASDRGCQVLKDAAMALACEIARTDYHEDGKHCVGSCEVALDPGAGDVPSDLVQLLDQYCGSKCTVWDESLLPLAERLAPTGDEIVRPDKLVSLLGDAGVAWDVAIRWDGCDGLEQAARDWLDRGACGIRIEPIFRTPTGQLTDLCSTARWRAHGRVIGALLRECRDRPHHCEPWRSIGVYAYTPAAMRLGWAGELSVFEFKEDGTWFAGSGLGGQNRGSVRDRDLRVGAWLDLRDDSERVFSDFEGAEGLSWCTGCAYRPVCPGSWSEALLKMAEGDECAPWARRLRCLQAKVLFSGMLETAVERYRESRTST